MRRSIWAIALALTSLTVSASPALAAPPTEGPGPWGNWPILCIVGYHLQTNPAHPEWGSLPFCLRDNQRP